MTSDEAVSKDLLNKKGNLVEMYDIIDHHCEAADKLREEYEVELYTFLKDNGMLGQYEWTYDEYKVPYADFNMNDKLANYLIERKRHNYISCMINEPGTARRYELFTRNDGQKCRLHVSKYGHAKDFNKLMSDMGMSYNKDGLRLELSRLLSEARKVEEKLDEIDRRNDEIE